MSSDISWDHYFLFRCFFFMRIINVFLYILCPLQVEQENNGHCKHDSLISWPSKIQNGFYIPLYIIQGHNIGIYWT